LRADASVRIPNAVIAVIRRGKLHGFALELLAAALLIAGLALPRPAFAQTASRAEDRTPQEDHALARAPADPEAERGSWLIPSLHGLGVMAGMRVGEALFLGDEFANADPEFIFDNWGDAFTKPPVFDSSQPAFEWDGDGWPTNLIGHGLFGSELYLRTRTCHKNVFEGFAFAVAGSTLWEYVIEGSAARPSAQDLVYTPVVGSLLGELRYQGWLAAGRWKDRTWGGVFKVVLDPLGELERAAGTRC
jgi:hypothetical protein